MRNPEFYVVIVVTSGVVECLAAGLLTIAHRSGGPKTDIIIESEGSRNGFLAASDDEYAQAMASIIRMPAKQRERVILAARFADIYFSNRERSCKSLIFIHSIFDKYLIFKLFL